MKETHIGSGGYTLWKAVFSVLWLALSNSHSRGSGLGLLLRHPSLQARKGGNALGSLPSLVKVPS
jgi:hypothetical protein